MFRAVLFFGLWELGGCRCLSVFLRVFFRRLLDVFLAVRFSELRRCKGVFQNPSI